MPKELPIEAALRSSAETFFHKYSLMKDRLLNVEYEHWAAGFPEGNNHGRHHILRVLEYLDQLLLLLNDRDCQLIADAIDPTRRLTPPDADNARELTKRLLFYVVRATLPLSFAGYRRWLDWATQNGYHLAPSMAFMCDDDWKAAITRVEKLNRQGYLAQHIDASQLFGNNGVALG